MDGFCDGWYRGSYIQGSFVLKLLYKNSHKNVKMEYRRYKGISIEFLH